MVRLQPIPAPNSITANITFNPTMVRLQRWLATNPIYEPVYFQSHYGAIATVVEDMKEHARQTFNPTMVRLQPTHLITGLQKHLLSIPLWCDCNQVNAAVGSFTFHVFQSHYGAIATRVGQRGTANAHRLSIPLWCDCNR